VRSDVNLSASPPENATAPVAPTFLPMSRFVTRNVAPLVESAPEPDRPTAESAVLIQALLAIATVPVEPTSSAIVKPSVESDPEFVSANAAVPPMPI